MTTLIFAKTSLDRLAISYQTETVIDLKNFSPCFLVAMPEMQDPYFEKSVIFLTDFNQDGAFGFIINKTSDMTLGEAVSFNNGHLNPAYHNVNLWYGGPVNTQQVWILLNAKSIPDKNAEDLGYNVLLAKDSKILTDHSRLHTEQDFRIFHGYAGWSAQQLDDEITNSLWITCPASNELIFSTPIDQIWEKSIQSLGIDPLKLIGTRTNFLN